MTDLRKIEKLTSDQWTVIRMSELNEGDKFRLSDNEDDGPFGTYLAKSNPYLNDDGIWGINAELFLTL